jgi:hypothetical protein
MSEKILTASAELKHEFQRIREELGDQITLAKFKEFVRENRSNYEGEKAAMEIHNVYYLRKASLELTNLLKMYQHGKTN